MFKSELNDKKIYDGIQERLIKKEEWKGILLARRKKWGIGIQMICDYFQFEGWKSICLGANTSIDGLLEMLRERNVDVLGVSVTMPYNVHKVKCLIEKIKQSSDIHMPKIIVCGIVFNAYPDLFKKVGADFFAENIEDALKIGNAVVKE
jgi:MerR family transcriptional regulator, light-induced transcriptional regulator